MIKDKQLIFSDAQAETTAAAHNGTNYIDLLKAGDAEPCNLVFVASVNTLATSAGAATLTVALQTTAATTDGDDGTWTTLLVTSAIALASLTAGAVLVQANVPRGVLRYLRVVYTIGTAALTAGKIDAFLTHDAQTNFNQ